jgi:hypothetical protein
MTESPSESMPSSPTSPLMPLPTPLHKSPEIHFTIEEQLRLENLRDYVKAMSVPR